MSYLVGPYHGLSLYQEAPSAALIQTGTTPPKGKACEEVVSRKMRSKKFSTPGALGMDSAALHAAPV